MNHHFGSGIGEIFTPIVPRNFVYSDWTHITIEEALLGDFTRQRSTMKHKEIALMIFQLSFEASMEYYLKLNLHEINPDLLFAIVSSNFTSLDTYRLARDQHGYDDSDIKQFVLAGKSCGYSTMKSLLSSDKQLQRLDQSVLNNEYNTDLYIYDPPIYNNNTDSLYDCVLWCRIHLTIALCIYYGIDYKTEPRISLFLDNHVKYVLQNQKQEQESRSRYKYKYVGCGISRFDKDRSKMKFERHYIPLKEDIIRKLEFRYPNSNHTFELRITNRILNSIDMKNPTFHIYNQIQGILETLKTLYETNIDKDQDKDLWHYYLCFVDILAIDKEELNDYNMINGKLLQQYYPAWNRAFLKDDLPDVFHALMQIPLNGERRAPETDLCAILQKCLPIASQRRGLITTTVDLARTNSHFWELFRKLFWCTMTHIPLFDMEKLHYILKICSDKKLFLQMWRTDLKKECSKATPVAFTIFRLWILKMLEEQDWYKRKTRQHVDWKYFEEYVERELRYIVANFDFTDFTDPNINSFDPLKNLRNDKGYENQVFHKYKDNTMTMFIREKLDKEFRKQLCLNIYEDMISLDRYDEYSLVLPVKQNILNLLVKMPIEDRYTYMTFLTLCLPEYGTISESSTTIMYELIHIYQGTAKPKKMSLLINRLPLKDYLVILWFFQVLSILENIQFIPIPKAIARLTYQSMKKGRYMVYPTVELDDSVYDIYMCICCKKLHTLCGKNQYGHEKMVVLDTSFKQLICKGTKTTANRSKVVPILQDDKEIVRYVRNSLLDFSCNNNPVLKIPLKGFMLHFQPSMRKHEYYWHCPSCGSFHQYDVFLWRDTYRCPHCFDDTVEQVFATCTMCEQYLKDKTFFHKSLEVTSIDPEFKGDYFQQLYFCKKHYNNAKNSVFRGVEKKQTFINTTERITEANKKRATFR